ncbi:MAG TPA: ABC transporter ATP-binding protein, partial [Thermoanaerobaculia bacterium]
EASRVAEAIGRVPGVLGTLVQGGVVRVRADANPGLVGAVVAAVAASGGELRDLAVSEPSLEAVFLKLTGKEYRE